MFATYHKYNKQENQRIPIPYRTLYLSMLFMLDDF